jgi:hypothetical protein
MFSALRRFSGRRLRTEFRGERLLFFKTLLNYPKMCVQTIRAIRFVSRDAARASVQFAL